MSAWVDGLIGCTSGLVGIGRVATCLDGEAFIADKRSSKSLYKVNCWFFNVSMV